MSMTRFKRSHIEKLTHPSNPRGLRELGVPIFEILESQRLARHSTQSPAVRCLQCHPNDQVSKHLRNI